MTAASHTIHSRDLVPTQGERSAVLMVLALTIAALLLGSLLRMQAEGATRTITNDAAGVSISVPAGWITDQGARDLLFSVFDPRNPDHRISVSQLTGFGGTQPLRDIARQHVNARGQIQELFRVTQERSTSLGSNANVFAIEYGFVESQEGRLPEVLQGLDYFMAGANGTILVSLVAPADEFEDARGRFDQLAATVTGAQ